MAEFLLVDLRFMIHDLSMPPVLDKSGGQARLRARSKRLLGNADRLEVAAAVARASGGIVHAQELANELGMSPPRVRAQLLAFKDAGLLRLLPRDGQIVHYERVADPYWDAAVALHAAWATT